MTHLTANAKRRTLAAWTLVLLLAASSAGYAQLTSSGCGGEGDPVCTRDNVAYTANNTYSSRSSDGMACDYGLLPDNNGYCQNSTRRHFNNTGTSTLGQQIEAQEFSIGADTPINWLSLMGTHNSFSSWNEGAEKSLVADQQWSLSDQLQAGARNIMLDVHFYFDQMRVCHNGNSDFDGLICPNTQDGRLYLFAIKEIAYWLKQNPGEFVILRLNNTVDDQYDFLLDGPIQEYLGSMAFTPNDFTGGMWPTLRELRGRGKQIIVIGNNSTQWIHSWSRYVLNDAYPKTTGLDKCYNDDGLDVRSRKYNQFAYISEDRSGSATLGKYRTGELDAYLFPLLDSCGFSFIDVDFLYSLSRAVVAPQKDDTDDRPQASVWSMAPGVSPATESPMVMAGLKMQPGQKSDIHPFACAGPGIGADQGVFPAVHYPASHPWKFTKAADIWKNGETACQSEFGSTYHFWAPGSGIEYGALVAQVATTFETAPFWVNYFGGPVLTGTPNSLTLKWNKTQALPAALTMILRGGQGGTLEPSGVAASGQETFFDNDNVRMVNSNTVAVTLNPQLASGLAPGTYSETLQIDETDPATGQINSTHFPVTLQLTDTLLLSDSVVTLGNCAGQQTARVFVKSGGAFTIAPDPWIHVTTDSNTSPATLVITVDPSGLAAGLHTGYIKVSAPNTTNGGAAIQVKLTVMPQTTITSSPLPNSPVTVDGRTFIGGMNFCWAAGTAHTVSAPASYVFLAGARARFSSWTDGGAPAHTFVQPNSADVLTANYALQYRLTAGVDNPAHGSVRVAPSSSDGYYNSGTTLTLTASPSTGYHFSDFQFNQFPLPTNPLVFQITGPATVVAEFSH